MQEFITDYVMPFSFNKPMLTAALIYWFVIGGLIGAKIGSYKNKVISGFIAGFLFNGLGWIYLLMISSTRIVCMDCGKPIEFGCDCPKCKSCQGAIAKKPLPPEKQPQGQVQGARAVKQELNAEYKDVVIKLMRNHTYISENLEITKIFPEILRKEKQWGNAKKIVDFFRQVAENHFKMEEDVLFPEISQCANDETRSVIKILTDEHKDLLFKMEQLEDMLNTALYPLNEEGIEKANQMITEIRDQWIAHADVEDEKIFPRVKK